MTQNAEAGLGGASERVWLGEVAALEESVHHVRRRQAEAETVGTDHFEAGRFR